MGQPGSFSSSAVLGIKPAELSVSGVNNVTFTVPDGEFWEVVLVEATAATSSTVGNRAYYLKSGSSPYLYAAEANVAASNTVLLQWSPTLDSQAAIQSAVDKNGATQQSLITRTNFLRLLAGQTLEIADAGQKAAGDTLNATIYFWRGRL